MIPSSRGGAKDVGCQTRAQQMSSVAHDILIWVAGPRVVVEIGCDKPAPAIRKRVDADDEIALNVLLNNFGRISVELLALHM